MVHHKTVGCTKFENCKTIEEVCKRAKWDCMVQVQQCRAQVQRCMVQVQRYRAQVQAQPAIWEHSCSLVGQLLEEGPMILTIPIEGRPIHFSMHRFLLMPWEEERRLEEGHTYWFPDCDERSWVVENNLLEGEAGSLLKSSSFR